MLKAIARRLKLPSEMRRGEGTLVLAIEDGGVVESASKTIPILLQTVDLTLYPEQGELVAGLENRVYLEAFTPAKKPADLAGVIVNGAGKEVARFRSEHEGRAGSASHRQLASSTSSRSPSRRYQDDLSPSGRETGRRGA